MRGEKRLRENNPGCRESRSWGQALPVDVRFEMVPSQLENLSYHLKTMGKSKLNIRQLAGRK